MTQTPSTAAVPVTEHLSNRRWWTLATVAIAQVMVVLDATVVNIALPSAQADLHFSNGDRQWVITAYSLAFASLLLFCGRLSDLLGRKLTFMLGLAGFALASLGGGAAQTFGELIAARAVQGAFGALLAPSALAVLTTTFTIPKERARAFGIFGALAGMGGAIGLLLGGFLTQDLNWRWNLTINVFIAAVAAIGAIAFVPRMHRTGPRPKLDVPGTLLVSAALFSLVFGFSNAESDSWSSPATWGFLAAAGVLAIAFVLWQRRATHPLLPLTIVADRTRGAAFLSVLIASSAVFAMFLFVTYYLRETMHYDPIAAGVAFLPWVGALVVVAQLSTNLLLPRLGPKVMVPTGMLLGVVGMLLLTRLTTTSTYAGGLLPALIVLGATMGCVVPASFQSATLGVDRHYAGVASATVNTSQQVGGSIGTALLNTLAATAAADYVKDHLPPTATVMTNAALQGYNTAYLYAAGIFAVGFLMSILLFRRRRPATVPAHSPATAAHVPAPAAAGA